MSASETKGGEGVSEEIKEQLAAVKDAYFEYLVQQLKNKDALPADMADSVRVFERLCHTLSKENHSSAKVASEVEKSFRKALENFSTAKRVPYA